MNSEWDKFSIKFNEIFFLNLWVVFSFGKEEMSHWNKNCYKNAIVKNKDIKIWFKRTKKDIKLCFRIKYLMQKFKNVFLNIWGKKYIFSYFFFRNENKRKFSFAKLFWNVWLRKWTEPSSGNNSTKLTSTCKIL